jgi:hypothetical protein
LQPGGHRFEPGILHQPLVAPADDAGVARQAKVGDDGGFFDN